MAEVLDRLPAGFVVFHDVPLPKPSRASIDHVVVAPCGLWAIRVEAPTQPVTFGEGRGADTLWAGRTPLRIPIEACESDAAALGAALARPVRPLLCIEAPLPADSFDFHGLLVCAPGELAANLLVTTSSFQDVAAVSRRIEDVSGVAPASTVELPRLGDVGGAAAVTVKQRWRTRRRRVPRRVRGSHVDRTRVFLVVGTIALVVALEPGWLGLDRDDGSSLTSVADVARPAPVDTTISCRADGARMVTWVWPGDLPDGVASYGIRTRHADGSVIDHTLRGWRHPDDPPMPVELSDDVVAVITEHRAEDGSVLAAAERPVTRPPGADC